LSVGPIDANVRPDPGVDATPVSLYATASLATCPQSNGKSPSGNNGDDDVCELWPGE